MGKIDMILKSNAIFTGCNDDVISGAVLIEGNKIAGVVSSEEAEKYMTEGTAVYEYEDKLIMPGFVDGHDHLWWGAVANSDHMVDVTASRSEEECVAMIKEYADTHPDEKRVLGFGWFPANWNDAPLPTKISLDEVVPDRPAYMLAADAHTCWLNSKALEESGYYPEMKVGGGSIGVWENGEMNGLIFEPDAMVNAYQYIYDFPEDQIRVITEEFMKDLAKKGVTCLSEMSADDYKDNIYKRYSVFKDMSDKGQFTSRVHVYTKLLGYTDYSVAKEWQKEFDTPTFKIVGLKGFLDGVASTYTALMLEPYADKPDCLGEGVPLATKEDLEASVLAANAAGFPVRIHCIGDGAVRMGLDAYEKSLEVNGQHGLVNTIEHIEFVNPDDIPRFAKMGVVPSMQGEHLKLDANEQLTRLGEGRTRWGWAFKSFLDSGAELAFGTDFPVVPFNQFVGIHAAVSRKNYDGSVAGVVNGENITVAQALRCNTLNSAKVYGRDHELGTLEAGKLADVIVVDRNLFTCPVDDINDAEVILTVMDGNVTYEK